MLYTMSNDAFSKAMEAMRGGDPQQAFLLLKPLIEYPSVSIDDAFEWGPRVELFSQIASAIAGPELGMQVRACGPSDDLKALYDVGFALIDQGLPLVAATFLARADALAPESPGIVMELCSALERGGLHVEVVRLLKRSPLVLRGSLLARYLLAFNSLASGDIEEAARAAASLGEAQDDTEREVSNNLRAMLARVSAARAAGQSLDESDLRGWFFVMNQSVLLHLSPHGPDVMRGRYAFVQDSPETCREGLGKLAALVSRGVLRVPRIFVLPERGSEILARAAAEVIGVPLAAWPSKEPGLVVAYDLALLDDATLKACMFRSPGQWLFAHASCWTNRFTYAPDFVTFLYQHNVAPWAERLVVDPNGGGATKSAPDARPADRIAHEIATRAYAGVPNEEAAIVRLSQALPAPAGEPRPRLRDDGPVKSARFA
jgi:hypothetical protein